MTDQFNLEILIQVKEKSTIYKRFFQIRLFCDLENRSWLIKLLSKNTLNTTNQDIKKWFKKNISLPKPDVSPRWFTMLTSLYDSENSPFCNEKDNKHFSDFSENILKDHVNGKTTKTHTKSKHAVNYWNGLNWPNKQDKQHLKSTMWEICSSDIMVESKAAVLASPTPVCWNWLLRYQIKVKLKSKLLTSSEPNVLPLDMGFVGSKMIIHIKHWGKNSWV